MSRKIPNIRSMLKKDETILRSHLLDQLIEIKRPFFPGEFSGEGVSSDLDVPAVLKGLSQKGLIASREDGAITGLYPVSALPTLHKVQIKDGRSFFAMCAIDALGASYELSQDVAISSSCKHCGKKISIEVSKGKLAAIDPPTIHALHVDIEKYKDWAKSC
jgi:hypothetical protein